VISTRPDADSALRRARERILQLDPLDVLPFDSFPRPRRALATLHPFHGRSHEQPRWMPDGITVLVTRDEPAPNGVTRPDLFEWNPRTGSVRRVTKGASIRQADPSPDGRTAVAVRCQAGTCSIVVIALRTGTWRELVTGSPSLVWHRPRYSPDGTRIVASYQAGGQWNVAIIDATSGAIERLATDDGVSRHSPVFTPDGRSLLVISDRGGIPNLERVPLGRGAGHFVTRVTGAVAGPDVGRADSSVWFLALRSGGYDLRRLARPDEGVAGGVVAISGPLAPAAPPTPFTVALPALSDSGITPVREYGLGPRRWRFLPGGTAGPDGHTTTLMAANIDPIGRLSIVTQVSYGSAGVWRGGSAAAALRRTRIELDASGWYVEHEPSRARDHLAGVPTDLRVAGGGLQARLSGERSNSAYFARAFLSASSARNALLRDASRLTAGSEVRARMSASLGRLSIRGLAGVLAEVGDTDGEAWHRASVSGALSVGTARHQLRADWVRGFVTAPSTSGFGRALEQFVVGGASNPLIDPVFLSQRVPLPGVPAGFVTGRALQLFNATLGGSVWEPWFIWVNTGSGFNDLRRIGGIERSFGIASLGFARLPSIRARRRVVLVRRTVRVPAAHLREPDVPALTYLGFSALMSAETGALPGLPATDAPATKDTATTLS
jgi:hypothetical protein